MQDTNPTSAATQALLSKLKAFCFPNGEQAGRTVRGLKSSQRGQIRPSPAAHWSPFTAEEWVCATHSEFIWEADLGSGIITSVHVTDGYRDGHGKAVLRKGPIPLKSLSGVTFDKGELQRYLGYVSYCPPILLHHQTLEWTEVGPRTLRVRDRLDESGATLDIELADSGELVEMRTIRPMAVGKDSVDTAWSARSSDYREIEGVRIPMKMEASWHPDSGAFTYVEIELTSVTLVHF